MASFEDLIPYCPICSTSFSAFQVTAFQFSCQHLFCNSCLQKLSFNGFYYCPFDCSYTSPQDVATQGNLQQQILQWLTYYVNNRRENTGILTFNRTVIPCRQNLRNHSQNCPYDHTQRFYKTIPCPLADQCPNATSCIFVHMNEKVQIPDKTGYQSQPIVPTEELSPTVMNHVEVPAPVPDQPESDYYSDVTWRPERRSAQIATPVHPDVWVCKNCNQSSAGKVCQFCTLRPS